MQTVRFEHKCADAKPHQVQAYTELGSDDGRARALVLVYARRHEAQGCDVSIGVRLVAMRLETGRASAKWSMSLEARTAATHHIGTEHSHYISCPARGERRRRPFRTDTTGVLEWLDHPESIHGTWSGGYPRNWSPKMETTAATLGMTRTSRTVALELVLTETDSGQSIRLSGPEIRIPDRVWRELPPRTPSWFAFLNPFKRYGLWKTLVRATMVRECSRQRIRAKQDFAVM